MATWYVNGGSAADSWGAGNDSTGTGTQAAPYATINKAETVATLGDTCIVKSASGGLTYVEDSGSGYLSTSKLALIKGDPTTCALYGLPVVRANSAVAIRVINLAAAGIARELRDLIIDGVSRASQRGVSPTTDSIVFTRITWRALAAVVLSTPTGSISVIYDGCTVENTCTTTTVFDLTSANLTNVTFLGGAYYAPAGASAAIYSNALALSGSLTFGPDSSGNPVSFTGNAAPYNIRIGGTIAGNLTINNTSHVSTAGGIWCISLTVTGAANINNTTATNLTAQPAVQWQGSSSASLTIDGLVHSGTMPAIFVAARSSTPMIRNVASTVLTGAPSGTAILVSCATGTPVIENCSVSIQAPSVGSVNGIQVGSDGISSMVSITTGTKAGVLNLGDVAGNTYRAQRFTTVAAASSADQTHLTAVELYLAKVLAPTGTLTGYLYSDNAGVPGTLLATSENTVDASTLSTTAALYRFSWVPVATSGATSYWFVVAVAGGTTNATNYVSIDYSTNATDLAKGTVAAGTAVPAWTADTTKSFRATQLYSCIYGCTPIVRNNSVAVLGSAHALSQQLITIGGTGGATVCGNWMSAKGYFPGVMKNCRGNTNWFGNKMIMSSANASVGAMIISKASLGANIYNNTCIFYGSNAVASIINLEGTSLGWTNNLFSTNTAIKNNIFSRVSSGNGPIYRILAGVSNTTADSNWVYTANPDNIAGASWRAWQAGGYDPSSVGPSTAPPLVNAATPTSAADLSIANAAGATTLRYGVNLNSAAPTGYGGAPFMPTPTVGADPWFTGGLACDVSGATKVYALALRVDGAVWNAMTAAWEQYVTSNLASYALGMAQMGGTTSWRGNFPSASAAGVYSVRYYSQAGGSPAESDTLISTREARQVWGGSAPISVAALGSFKVAT